MVARYFRMKGWNVIIPWYADRNGLPIEVAVEKKYGIVAHKIARTKEGRKKFLEICRKELDEMEKDYVELWTRMGCSFTYVPDGTDSEKYRILTQATFIELWKRGLIREDEKPVDWCPRCRTTLSEAEIEYKEEEGYLYYVKWKIAETNEEIIIATTRPELIGATRLVIFNPEDNRYKRFDGLHAIIPIYGEKVPIKKHPAANPQFGTGLVMVSTYGDWRDVQLINELNIEPKILINENGYMNEKAGPIKDLSIREAREKIVNILNSKKLIMKTEKIKHRIPIC